MRQLKSKPKSIEILYYFVQSYRKPQIEVCPLTFHFQLIQSSSVTTIIIADLKTIHFLKAYQMGNSKMY